MTYSIGLTEGNTLGTYGCTYGSGNGCHAQILDLAFSYLLLLLVSGYLRILVYLVICDFGEVSLEHLLLSKHPSQKGP